MRTDNSTKPMEKIKPHNFIEQLWLMKKMFKDMLVALQSFFLLPCNLYSEFLLVV